eukprot:TRINITY_DN13426_c0_g1_i1.p1 TRINITY_DN13426_c0_g1~~TRINITY_DN13426_c0_g1_i1.p1  ORF type:complete len:506 (+),score=130.74 TRINITY_DN13426_c0_g1_i1:26-1543(+)
MFGLRRFTRLLTGRRQLTTRGSRIEIRSSRFSSTSIFFAVTAAATGLAIHWRTSVSKADERERELITQLNQIPDSSVLTSFNQRVDEKLEQDIHSFEISPDPLAHAHAPRSEEEVYQYLLQTEADSARLKTFLAAAEQGRLRAEEDQQRAHLNFLKLQSVLVHDAGELIERRAEKSSLEMEIKALVLTSPETKEVNEEANEVDIVLTDAKTEELKEIHDKVHKEVLDQIVAEMVTKLNEYQSQIQKEANTRRKKVVRTVLGLEILKDSYKEILTSSTEEDQLEFRRVLLVRLLNLRQNSPFPSLAEVTDQDIIDRWNEKVYPAINRLSLVSEGGGMFSCLFATVLDKFLRQKQVFDDIFTLKSLETEHQQTPEYLQRLGVPPSAYTQRRRFAVADQLVHDGHLLQAVRVLEDILTDSLLENRPFLPTELSPYGAIRSWLGLVLSKTHLVSDQEKCLADLLCTAALKPGPPWTRTQHNKDKINELAEFSHVAKDGAEEVDKNRDMS